VTVAILFGIEGLKTLVGWVGSAGSWIHTLNSEKKTETKTALDALLKAVRNTRPYVAQMKGDQAKRDTAIEQHLSELWADVGVAMLPINREIAALYVRKADYWSYPDDWDERNSENYVIELEEVRRLGEEALLHV
jgi:hypothetical protein